MTYFRVIVIDSETATRRRTSALLAATEDVDVVGVARSGSEALQLAAAVEPNVVLLSPNLHDSDGLGLIQQLMVDLPGVYFIILSRQSDAQYLQSALLAGANAFLSQPAPADPLIAAIRKGAPRT